MPEILKANEADFLFALADPKLLWGKLHVVRFHGVEEISRPYVFDITLAREAEHGPLELHELVDDYACLAIATDAGWRRIHGVVARAERLEHTKELILYRVRLVPALWRLGLRSYSRTFVGQSLEAIIEAVLEGQTLPDHVDGHAFNKVTEDPKLPSKELDVHTFVSSSPQYRWRIHDEETLRRLRDKTLRDYVVQYNETDLDFVSRLLEEEGISYYFEHTDQAHMLILSDRPGSGGLLPVEEHALRVMATGGGHHTELQVVRAFHECAELSAEAVIMRDSDWHRAPKVLEATHQLGSLVWRPSFTYPARDEAVGRAEDGHRTSDGEPEALGEAGRAAGSADERAKGPPCAYPARVGLERIAAQRALARGRGTCRRLEPGRRFALRDHDMNVSYQEQVTVRVETFAVQLELPDTEASREVYVYQGRPVEGRGLHNHFISVHKDLVYRPPMRTPHPRIDGVHTATVWGPYREDGSQPDIYVDDDGRVLLRFPWDQRHAEAEETVPSCWVRVSNQWAGSGYGALYTPRVGHEVLVAYHRGDPDRPVIVGRVYNGLNKPPYDPAEHPTKSTVKSKSSSVGKAENGFNELLFEDKSGGELFKIHAQRDMNEHVNNCHTTFVGADQSHVVKNDRTRTVEGKENITVNKDRDRQIHGADTQIITKYRRHEVKKDDVLVVTGDRTVVVTEGDSILMVDKGKRDVTVNKDDALKVEGKRTVEVAKKLELKVTEGDQFSDVASVFRVKSGLGFEVKTQSTNFEQAMFQVSSGSAGLMVANTCQVGLDTGAGAKIFLNGDELVIQAKTITLKADLNIKLDGLNVQETSSAFINMNA